MRLLIMILILIQGVTSEAQDWQELNTKTSEYYNSGNFTKALHHAERALQQAEVEFGKRHENYGISLFSIAQSRQYLQQIDEAIL